MPDISVLMSVYNGERWLRDSIDSVLSQSEDDFEFIIINDGSIDDTPLILNSFNDERLIIIDQENIGLTKSLNRGLSIAKGKFVARIDADDICMLDRFYEQKKFLVENPEVVLVGSNAVLIDENNNDIGYTACPTSHDSLLRRLTTFRPVFPHSSILFRKDIVISEGGYNPYFTRSQDNELYLRLSEKYQLAGLDEYLVKLRITRNSLSYNDDLQLKMGIAVLICYYRRKEGLKDFSTFHTDEWLSFLNQIDDWLVKSKFKKRRAAKNQFRHFRNLIKEESLLKALPVLLACFKIDSTFFMYRDINLNVPKDIEQFLASNTLA